MTGRGRDFVRLTLFLVAWLALSAGVLSFGFVLVADLFGREGNGLHLLGFILVAAAWLGLSGLFALLVRRRMGRNVAGRG